MGNVALYQLSYTAEAATGLEPVTSLLAGEVTRCLTTFTLCLREKREGFFAGLGVAQMK